MLVTRGAPFYIGRKKRNRAHKKTQYNCRHLKYVQDKIQLVKTKIIILI